MRQNLSVASSGYSWLINWQQIVTQHVYNFSDRRWLKTKYTHKTNVAMVEYVSRTIMIVMIQHFLNYSYSINSSKIIVAQTLLTRRVYQINSVFIPKKCHSCG